MTRAHRVLGLVLLPLACDDGGPVVRRADGGAAQTGVDAAVPPDVFVPDGACLGDEACGEKLGGRYLRCVRFRCVECAAGSACDDRSLGGECVGAEDGGSGITHCVCRSDGDCAGRATGPRCLGVPGYCGCTAGADCPSGTCAPDDYVAGSVCVP
jgi:hypothetical protein